MTDLIPVGIAGLGKALPEKELTNADLERLVDTSDEWIQQRTGIAARRMAAPGDTTSALSVRAARMALEKAGIDGSELDLILCCTVTPDQPFPATACRIGKELGAEKAGGWDIVAACSGFVYGAQTAAGMIASGMYKNILVVGVELLTKVLDFEDRNTCVLFGDGAGAAVFTSLDRAGKGELLSCSVGMDGGNEDNLCIPAGGTRMPTSAATVAEGMHTIKMGGSKVFRFAVKTFADLVDRSLAPYSRDELGVIVPHQVNQRIIESAMDRLDMPYDLIFSNIHKYGNTSAASVPIALCEAEEEGRCIKDKLVCIVAFGAGMAWGHLLLRW